MRCDMLEWGTRVLVLISPGHRACNKSRRDLRPRHFLLSGRYCSKRSSSRTQPSHTGKRAWLDLRRYALPKMLYLNSQAGLVSADAVRPLCHPSTYGLRQFGNAHSAPVSTCPILSLALRNEQLISLQSLVIILVSRTQ